MFITVEPTTGHEIERLITALLNATGCIKRVIEATDPPPHLDGPEIIGLIADRLHGILTPLAEHSGDEGLAVVTGALTEVTLLIADELGLHGMFGPPGN
jgi:hypothetical protein